MDNKFFEELDDKRIEVLHEIRHQIEDERLSLFIYGAGTYAGVVHKYLCDNDIKAKTTYIVDDEFFQSVDEDTAKLKSHEEKNGGVEQGKYIIPFSTFLDEYATDSLLVFGIYNYPIIKGFREKYKHIIPYMYEIHLTVVYSEYLEWNRNYIVENSRNFEETYKMFEDELSKNTMKKYLEVTLGGNFSELYDNCYSEPPYFNELTANYNIDVLIDCGAFNGDSIHDFVRVFPKYKSIYAFEPDEDNVKKIEKRRQDERISNLNIISKGVYSETRNLCFDAEGKSSSHISLTGESIVRVMRLDDLLDIEYGEELADLDDKRILIKMDIEGSELEALRGAAYIIKKHQPCMAICVYHKEEDMITIPKYIKSLVGDGAYKFFLRFHGKDLAELVFYAIPKNYIKESC